MLDSSTASLHHSITPFHNMPLGLLGKKLGQTRVYDTRGTAHSVTIVLAGPNRVLQCKTNESDGYQAVQLGFDDQKEQRLTKPLLGHIKKFNGTAVKRIREFRNFSKHDESSFPRDIPEHKQTRVVRRRIFDTPRPPN